MFETLAPDSLFVPPLDHRLSKRLRIVLVGGFGMQPKATMTYRALPIGHALAARGHEVTIVVPPWDHPADASRIWEENGIRVVNTGVPAHAQMPRIMAALRAAVRNAAPDVIHVFKPKGYSGLLIPLLRDFPLVLDTDDWEGAGGWNDRGDYSRWQRRLFAWQERSLPRRAGHITVASRALETQQWGLGIPPKHVTYLPNAIDTVRYATWRDGDRIARDALAVRGRLGLGGPTLLLYTRFVEFAPATVAAMLSRLRTALPKARLMIVGGSLHGEDAAVRHALAAYDDAVLTVGFVPFTEVPGYIRAADVALVPFEDTLINRAKSSVKTLDLLAVGQTIVATAVGENASMIRHNETGVLVPPGDADALVAAVVALLCDPARARSLGEAARMRAWREQTWYARSATLEAIYARVTEEARRS